MNRLKKTVFLLNIFLLSISLLFSQNKEAVENVEVESYKVNSVKTLDYKYVPSINELIRNGTFIPEDPENYLKKGPKKLRKNRPVKSESSSDFVRDPLIDINSIAFVFLNPFF
mgnify:FL=1